MGHNVTGLISTPTALEELAAGHRLHRPVRLTKELAILALRDDDLDSFIPPTNTVYFEGFTYLSREVLQAFAPASISAPLVYFETDYAGGTGCQAAAVIRQGDIEFAAGGARIGPINEALRLIRVNVAPPAVDEFQTVGLHRVRHIHLAEQDISG